MIKLMETTNGEKAERSYTSLEALEKALKKAPISNHVRYALLKKKKIEVKENGSVRILEIIETPL